MNEESIIYIINYIHQFPEQPIEVLVQNIMSSGYNMTDLKEALRRLNISPIVIPGYKEAVPPAPKPVFSKQMLIIMGIAICVLLMGVSAFVLLSPKKDKSPEISGKIQQPMISEPTPTPTITTLTITPSITTNPLSIDDPTILIKEALSKANYKVIIENGLLTPNGLYGPVATMGAYMKAGKLARIEVNLQPESDVGSISYILIDNNNYITLNTGISNKTYSNDYLFGYRDTIEISFLPLWLISQSEKNNINWNKVSDFEWNTELKTSQNIREKELTVFLDPQTHLINMIYTKQISPETYVQYQYKKIDMIDSFLSVSNDYKQVPGQTAPTP